MTNQLSHDAFRSRERALENTFFLDVDKKLLAQLKAQLDAEEQVLQLRKHTGFTDEHLLDELVELGVSVESLTAMSIIPLVLVAWADFQVDRLERFDILKEAAEVGIETDTPAGQFLCHWLDNRPTPTLKEAWNHYVLAMLSKLTDKGRKTMKTEVLKRVRAIARVSGGPLGLGFVSSDEKRVIAAIEEAFEIGPQTKAE
ncbi:MAG: hypothetical protein ACI87E_004808 [Mariniblastus sp.]|jgi:hypothetical protein